MYGSIVDRGVKYGVSEGVGESVDWGVGKNVGAGIDRYIGIGVYRYWWLIRQWCWLWSLKCQWWKSWIKGWR